MTDVARHKAEESEEYIEAQKQTLLRDEAVKQAESANKEHKAKIELDLRQKGYDAIEAGLADVETKNKEALEVLEIANKERATVRSELESVASEKQKAVNALVVVKERERLVNEKWTTIIAREENEKTFTERYEVLKSEMVELITYYKSHLQPCIKALKAVNKTVYTWMDTLNGKTGYDWLPLYNFVGAKLKQIDDFTDHTDSIKLTDTDVAVDDNSGEPNEQGEPD